MPFNVSGVFQRIYSWVTDRDSGVKISAARMDSEINGVADALTAIVQQTQPFKGALKATSGTAALPAYSFDADPNTGIYRPGADQLAVSANGVRRLLMSTDGNTWSEPHLFPDGSASVPAMAFASAPTTGFYRLAASGDIIAQVGGAGGILITGQGATIQTGAALLVNGRIEIGSGGNLIPAVVATGTANALAVTVPNLAPRAFWMWVPAANTGSVTLSINGAAAVTLKTPTGSALPAGYTRLSDGADQPLMIVYGGADWVALRGIERGSNANGEWVRHTDGTQICTSTVTGIPCNIAAGSVFRSDTINRTYPNTFAAVPAGGGSVTSTLQAWINPRCSSASWGAQMYAHASRAAEDVSLTAIGRWY